MIQHDDVAPGIDGNAEHFTEIHVGRVLEKIGLRVERYRRHCASGIGP
jgi:hypothetical protein